MCMHTQQIDTNSLSLSHSHLATDCKSLEWSGWIWIPRRLCYGGHVEVVEVSLNLRGPQVEDVLDLRREGALENLVPLSEDEPLEERVEDVGSITHQTNILQAQKQLGQICPLYAKIQLSLSPTYLPHPPTHPNRIWKCLHLTVGVLSIHWPFVIGRSNRSANSCLVPRRLGRTKSTMHQYSVKLFWRGYPVITIRLLRECTCERKWVGSVGVANTLWKYESYCVESTAHVQRRFIFNEY